MKVGEKMAFDLNIEEEFDIDLDLQFKDIVIDENMYISDINKALELISELIKNKPDSSYYYRNKIKNQINQLFSYFSEVSLKNEMIFYEKFMNLCARLSERQKISKIHNKVVVSFGGKVSAGKSKFINTISGIGEKLPVNQKTTTAIPTYIIKSEKENILVNSVYGYSVAVASDALNAMAHEFDTVYGIGFPAFVDSIIIESREFKLSNKIALLDTPGYTKYDEESDSKRVISDRERAFQQLSISDYLIWLIDIDCGAITEDDIQFIESLKLKTPILIVFTKSDLKTDEEIDEIIKVASETIERTTINCFGITAYSSDLKKEHKKNSIKQYLTYAIKTNVRNNDIMAEFINVENEMREAIKRTIESSKETSRRLFTYITKSDKIMEIKSLAYIWGKENQNSYILNYMLKIYDILIEKLNQDIEKYLSEEG